MRKTIIVIFLSIVMSIFLIGCNFGKDTELTTKEKVEDFNQLFEAIKSGYPFLEVNKRVNGIDFIANKEEYLERIKNTKNDDEFISELSAILRDLNNGHTHLVTDKELFNLCNDTYSAFGWYDFFDDTKVKERYKKMPLSNLSNNTETESYIEPKLRLEDVVQGEVGYMHLPIMNMEKASATTDLNAIEYYIRTLDDHKSLIIDIRGNSGGDDSYWTSIVSMLINNNMKMDGYVLFRDNGIINSYLDAREIATLPINQLSDEVIKNAPKEVLTDFRGYMESNVYIEAKPVTKFSGNIYLLVDEAVYSSSESFAVFCKESKFATLVGTKTSGDGGGIDPVLFNLKNSGLVVRMAEDMFLTPSGECNEELKTTPEYIIENNNREAYFEDDKAIDKVLELAGIK